jgi:DNA-binding NarL/FixJ family response regulator
MAGETILNVAYDSLLKELRESALERHGYRVVSVIGNEAAKRLVSSAADLVVIGNGGILEERLEMVRWLARNCPQVAVIVMSADERERYPQGTVVFQGDTPNDLVTLVQRVIVSHRKLRKPTASGA